MLGDFGCDREESKRIEEESRFNFLASAQTGIDFSNIHRATSQKMPLIQESFQKQRTTIALIEMIQYYGSIEKQCRQLFAINHSGLKPFVELRSELLYIGSTTNSKLRMVFFLPGSLGHRERFQLA